MTTPTTTDAAIAQASDTLYLALAGIKDTFPTGSVQRSAIWQAMHFVALAKNVSTETPATAHGGSSPDITDAIAHGVFVYEIDYGPDDKWRGVRLEDFNKVVAKLITPPAGGFVVVPREATHEMEYALSQALDSGDYSIGECLNRANAAAPESNSPPKSGIALGTEIEGIPWTEEMEDTFNKTMPKVRELVGLSGPSASDVRAYMVDGRVEQGLFFDKDAAENMALANCGTVIPLIAAPTAQPSAKDGVRVGKWHGPTLDAVLRGLRSEDDSTQLRAIISSVETMREEATTAAGLVDGGRLREVLRRIQKVISGDGGIEHWIIDAETEQTLGQLIEAAIGREVESADG